MENRVISIIIPVYNVEKYLSACLESILSQTYPYLEVILVDDGSTDRSGTICDEYSQKDTRVRVIHQRNSGQASARNRGLDIARGSFVGFIDSDDWIEDDMFESLFKQLKSTDADLVACNIFIYDKQNHGHLYFHGKQDGVFNRIEAMEELYKNERLTFSPCNKLYKKELIGTLRFKQGYILEDMDFIYQVVHQASRVAYIANPLYNYRYNENSTMRKVFSKKRLDEYEVRKDMYEFYAKHYPRVKNELYAEVVLTGAMLFINMKKYFKKESPNYKYLIQYERNKLYSLVKDPNYNKKKKLLLALAVVSPHLFIRFYWFYWDLIKKQL